VSQNSPDVSTKLTTTLAIISELNQIGSQVHGVAELLQRASERMQSQFDLYQVKIYWLDDGKHKLDCLATSPLGLTAVAESIELGSTHLVAQVAATKQPLLMTGVAEWAATNTRSQILLPLVAIDSSLVGVFDLQSDREDDFIAIDDITYQTFATQLVSLVQNVQLRLQANRARFEIESLYQAGVALNTATSYHEILDILHQYTLVGWGNHINLNYFDIPWTKSSTPQSIDVLARRTNLPTEGLPTHYPISAFPSTLAILHPDRPTIIEDVTTSPILDESLRKWYLDVGFQSVIFVPVVVGGKWLGFFNIAYPCPHQFLAADVRRLTTLIAQSAVAIQNLRNIEILQQRTAQLELLSQVEVALSKATDEGELLAVLGLVFFNTRAAQINSNQDLRLTLHYTETNDQGQLVASEVVAIWQYGQLQLQDALMHHRFELVDFPLAHLWLEKPSSIFIVPHIADDPRIDEPTRAVFLKLNSHALVIIPLYSGRRWQGIIFCSWTKPYIFNDLEKFVLERLVEPTAAAVATRRIYLLEQKTRHDVEQRVRHDRLVQEITEKMRQATSLQQLVKITAEELGRHFSAEHIFVELGLDLES